MDFGVLLLFGFEDINGPEKPELCPFAAPRHFQRAAQPRNKTVIILTIIAPGLVGRVMAPDHL